MTFNPNEPRDEHGRWAHGSVSNALAKSKEVAKAVVHRTGSAVHAGLHSKTARVAGRVAKSVLVTGVALGAIKTMNENLKLHDQIKGLQDRVNSDNVWRKTSVAFEDMYNEGWIGPTGKRGGPRSKKASKKGPYTAGFRGK